jgi:predicted nucleotidyltransferase
MEVPAQDSSIERLKSALAELAEVRLAFLFGSRARGRRARPDSDYDVAVLVGDDRVGQSREGVLRRVVSRLGREVSSAHLDMVLLDDAPPLLRQRVLRDGVLLFEREPGDRARFARRTIRDYQDGSVRREDFTRRRITRLKGSGAIDGGPGDLLEKARGAARLLAAAEGIPRG